MTPAKVVAPYSPERPNSVAVPLHEALIAYEQSGLVEAVDDLGLIQTAWILGLPGSELWDDMKSVKSLSVLTEPYIGYAGHAVEGAERLLSALKVAYERNTEESTVAIAAIIDRRPLHLMIEGKGSLEGVSMRSDKSGERRLVWHAGNGADMVGLHTVSSLSLLVAALPEEERIAILSYRASKV